MKIIHTLWNLSVGEIQTNIRKNNFYLLTMKVTHIFWSLGFGGIETMLVNIANEQVEVGAEVSVVIINDWLEQSLVDGLSPRVNLVRVNRRLHSQSLSFIYQLNRALGELRPDVIHLHSSGIIRLLHSKYRRIACSTLHALPTGAVRRGRLMNLVPFAHMTLYKSSNVVNIDEVPQIFAISNLVQRALRNNYGVESTVVCNGIVTSRFAIRPGQIPSEQLRIVMVSRLEHDKKGQDLLIRAAAALQGAVTVDFIGIGSSMEYLKQLTAELHAGEYVRFLGKQTQDYVAAHLADYDLFVQPSRWEGFGLTVAEAMAACVPVLVSEGQGPAEVTQGDCYGWLFANGDDDDLQQQIVFIKEHYGEAMTKARESQEYVRNMYDVSVTAQSYLREYENLISRNKVK